MYQILLVGGTYETTQNPDNTYGKPSGIIRKLTAAIQNHPKFIKQQDTLTVKNGGSYDDLQDLLQETPNFDIVFWFANVPDNHLPKLRDVKQYAPKVMLITSKRNDNQKYDFQELIQRALKTKSNLVFEFSKQEDHKFNTRIFDPLGCCWYNGTDIGSAVSAALDRLYILIRMTRQATTQGPEKKIDVFQTYLDKNLSKDPSKYKLPETSEINQFIKLARSYAEDFHRILRPAPNVQRFLGNCSLRPSTRCAKGFPSFKTDDYIFMSKRNVNKEFLDINHFVPCYLKDGSVYYCGEEKPSVDTPIQLRLYRALPNIRYMLHSHCYLDGDNFCTTKRPVPCGALEEVNEILTAIDEHYKDRTKKQYLINLIGHGSIIMGHSISDIQEIHYTGRPLPEVM